MNARVEASAREFARIRHAVQTDKLGVPYFHHLADVARRVIDLGPITVSIAWLHDCVEDTSATLDEIEKNFGGAVRDGVDAITRRVGEDYFNAYLPRLRSNPHAIPVKIADASHNLGKAHLLATIAPEKAAGLEKKYKRVLEILGAPVTVPERLVFADGGWRSIEN
jgi:(p)ppGpp synthase/HD superfamily hydrolase